MPATDMMVVLDSGIAEFQGLNPVLLFGITTGKTVWRDVFILNSRIATNYAAITRHTVHVTSGQKGEKSHLFFFQNSRAA